MSGATILVIATSARSARVADLLTQADYRVIEAPSAEAALDRAIESARLVIVNLAEGDVAATIEAVKARHPNVATLQIGAADTANVAAGIDAFLMDPIDPRELLTLVGSLLRFQKTETDLRDSERRLELAQESAKLAILDWGITTNSFVYSAAFADLFDLPDRAGEGFSPAVLMDRIHPEDVGPLLMEFSVESQTARSFDKELRIVRRDGEIRWIATRGRFFVDPSGLPERMLALSFDITLRKESDRINAQLASIVASSIDAIVSIDLDTIVMTWNAGAERLFGCSAAEMIGQPLDQVLVQDPAATADLREKLAAGEASLFETTQTSRDGTAIDVSVNSAPMRGPRGGVIGASLIMRDIAPQKRREAHVRFLMRELTHRSKNLLAVIQAMARQSLNKEITPEEFVKRFSNRLSGLAGSHDLLSAVEWRGASLIDLIHSQLRHYEDLFETRVILDGPEIVIRPEAAQNIGIALHELSTNAAKYGALSTNEGTVTIAWHIDEATTPPRLIMTWREASGPAVTAPTRKGFGHIVMDRIAGQALSGTSGTQFPPDGVVWTLDVPASAVVYVDIAPANAVSRH